MPSRSLHNPLPYWRKSRRKLTGTGWPTRIADDIWERDGGTCIYCGEHGEVIDHVIPASQGGPTSRSNGVVACAGCNSAKSFRIGNDREFILYATRGLLYLASKGEQIPYNGKVRELPADYEVEASSSEILQQQLPDAELAQE